uniref:uncharacterized protein LOC120343974 isoform X2 n=1 Tax=Styela clava TaxID=7725 RepID=UPI00193A5762|nr:uncharacterized protein LOC120343974 isoform X2 [Styela clava]
MHVTHANVIICILVYVVGIQGDDGINTCITLADSRSNRYFHAFESLPLVSEHAYGCASKGSASALNDTYWENHVMNVQNDRPADIYLNINGIHHRTTNSLPHYKEYKYEFALYSKKDVIWLVSTTNMPKSSVEFSFYLSKDSRIIFLDEDNQFRSVNIDLNESSRQDSSKLLIVCRKYFTSDTSASLEPKITSFTEFDVSKIATVNVLSGYNKDSLEPEHGNFTECRKLEKTYVSPLVSIQHYDVNEPKFVCERNHSLTKQVSQDQAFVLELTSHTKSETQTRVVNLEITGKEITANLDAKTILVLRSTTATIWNIRAVDDLRLNNFLFVSEKHDEIRFVDSMKNSIISYEDLHEEEKDPNNFDRMFETSHNCTVVSYSQYSFPSDLIFFTLSDQYHEVSEASPVLDIDDLDRIAHDIYSKAKSSCQGSNDWILMVPTSALNNYGLTESNLMISYEGQVCDPISINKNIEYVLNDCKKIRKDGNYETQMTVIFKFGLGHFYSVKGEKSETTKNLILICDRDVGKDNNNDHAVKNHIISKITSSCSTDVMRISIPTGISKHLLLTGIQNCKSSELNDSSEFTFDRNAEETCGATFEDGLCKIRISVSRDVLDGEEDFIILSCRDASSTATVDYKLDVYYDFSLKDKVIFPATVTQVDDITYHFKVSLISNDPSLTIYLSECSLIRNPIVKKTLIRNNCPADEIISFIRPFDSSSTNYQHFAVKVGGLVKKFGSARVQCEVSSCTTDPDSNCVPTVPQCFHPHGDRCTTKSYQEQINVATYLDETVKTGEFLYVANTSQPIGKSPSFPAKGVPHNEKHNTNENDITLGITSWPIILILALAAFALGAILISVLWRIDRRSYSKPKGPRTPASRESNSSGESGGSRSTSSTKTNGSSFSSPFCFKTHKETCPTSSKDDLEMETNPLIKSSTSKSTQPQNIKSPEKKPPDPVNNGNQVTMRDDRKLYIHANGNYQRLRLNTTSVKEQPTSNGSAVHDPNMNSTTSYLHEPQTSGTAIVPDSVVSEQVISLYIPHTDNDNMSYVRQNSEVAPQNIHLSSTENFDVTSTSKPSYTNSIIQPQNNRRTSMSIEIDPQSPLSAITKDEFDKLKEVML